LVQVSLPTVRELTLLVEQTGNGQRVNSVFGEGVNPRLRKVRDGLDTLGFPSDALLVHGSQRIVYIIPLAHNFRECLLGRDEKPSYYLPIKEPKIATDLIAYWWTERWLLKRIQSEEVLARAACHTLVHPIRHGARVPMPVISEISEDFDQLSLFDETEESTHIQDKGPE
jgi:hypothetical protein